MVPLSGILSNGIVSYTLSTLQPISPVVIGIGQNAPVLQLPSKVRMAPCDTVAKRPLPCESHGYFRKFKISTSDLACVDDSAHARMNFLLL